jgi:hypothetical protein
MSKRDIDRDALQDVLADLVDELGMVEVLQSIADVSFEFSAGDDRWRKAAGIIDVCAAGVERILEREKVK